ncbi:MAG: hypothetical protein IID44_14885 [Planctomycetes bacterium]|nr:hypothetical protein [Planctomycetota bacterium]
MTCIHLKELFSVCETHHLKLTSTDIVRIVCPQCHLEEVCPSVYSLEYDERHELRQAAEEPAAGDS